MDWQYFYKARGQADPAKPPRALGRTDRGGPPYNAQMLDRDAEWVHSDFLARYWINGSNDDDYVEIPEERALEIIEEWVTSGRLPRWPDEPKRPSA
jgi:hypothetical protein